MIEVSHEYQRKAYGTKLINYLKKYFDDKKIIYSSTTDSGDKFLKAIGKSTN